MTEWWNSLPLLGHLFAYIAIPSTLLMFIQIIMMLIGLSHSDGSDFDADVGDGADGGDFIDLDGDGIPDSLQDGLFGDHAPDPHGEFHSDTHTDSGFRLISFRSVVAALAVFGWTGLVMLKSGVGATVTLVSSFAIGVLVMTTVGFIFMWLFRLQSDGTINIKNGLGASGTVYLKIPPNRQGQGKVNIVIQGTYTELTAVTDEEAPINYGEEIVVIGLSGESTLVVKRK